MASTSASPNLPLEHRKRRLFNSRTGREEELPALVSPAKTERHIACWSLNLSVCNFLLVPSSPLSHSHLPLYPPPFSSSGPIPLFNVSLPARPRPRPLQDPSWCQTVHFLSYACVDRDNPQWAEAIELMDRDLRWLLTLDHAQFWNQVESTAAAACRHAHPLHVTR